MVVVVADVGLITAADRWPTASISEAAGREEAGVGSSSSRMKGTSQTSDGRDPGVKEVTAVDKRGMGTRRSCGASSGASGRHGWCCCSGRRRRWPREL